MNDLTDSLVKEYAPRLAIVVYASDTQSWGDCYLESHIILGGKLMAGKPLQQETIEGIVDVFYNQHQEQAKVTGLIPENLLHFSPLPGGHHRMAWYRPAERRVLHFDNSLKTESGEAWVPPTIWMIERRELNIFALKQDKRPALDTKLFQAPFHNTADNGRVCLGSARAAKPKEKTYSDIMKYWEDMFYLSVFTHITGASPTKTNINMLWQRLIADKKLKWENLDELLPCGQKTLKSILK